MSDPLDELDLPDEAKDALRAIKAEVEGAYLDRIQELEADNTRLRDGGRLWDIDRAEVATRIDDDPLDDLGRRAVALCEANGWDLGWRDRGCYLHLEASELTEALRGKGESTVTEEAGDVLFVLLSILNSRGIPFGDVMATIDAKMVALEGVPEPPG